MLIIDASRQLVFAALSGDFNPLHVDADQARRSQFGGCVVHGVHLVLAALDSLKMGKPFSVVRLDAQFRSAVMLGEAVSFTHNYLADGSLHIAVVVGNQVRTSITLELEQIALIGVIANRLEWPRDVHSYQGLDQLAGVSGSDDLAIDEDNFASLFPSLSASLSRTDAAALLATTRVVGMRCPGQWALFRRLIWHRAEDLKHDNVSGETIFYHVFGVDKRFSMVTLALNVGCRVVRAEVILREAPPKQIGLEVVRSQVRSDEFKGVRALIVGASRGLGELTTKLLAAGGADVLVTYRTGAEDAARVVAHLGSAARAIQFAVDAPDPTALAQIIEFAPTHISYFATPVIAKRPFNSWDPLTFSRFIEVYVVGLSQLLAIAQSGGSLKSLFFPSSTFVDEVPAGFAEYVAAKMSGEALCAAWQRIHPAQRVVIERLPPLVTDQTSAQLGTDTLGNLDVMLPILRRIFK